jgi:hypothetical protein
MEGLEFRLISFVTCIGSFLSDKDRKRPTPTFVGLFFEQYLRARYICLLLSIVRAVSHNGKKK